MLLIFETFLQMMFLRETCPFVGAEIDQLKKSEISPKLEDQRASL